jgi:hypothetical protein
VGEKDAAIAALKSAEAVIQLQDIPMVDNGAGTTCEPHWLIWKQD